MSTVGRLSLGTVCIIFLWWAGWKGYSYFGDTQAPDLTLSGLEHEGWYSGDVPCLITMHDNAKVATLSITLDGKPLVTDYRINRYKAEYSFTLPTATLPPGPHELCVKATDASYAHNTATETVLFTTDNIPLQAAFVRSDSDIKIFQGRTLHLVFQVSKPIKTAMVKTLGRTTLCVPEAAQSLVYEAFVPVACDDRPNEYPLTIEITDRVGNVITLETKFQVVLYPFQQQRLTLKTEDIAAERAAGADEKELEDSCAFYSAQSPTRKLWQGLFYPPTDIKRISTAFGTIRITQHRGKYMHKAIDIVTDPKHVIWAPQSGVVIVKKRFSHSGNTIVIDHGCGVLTLYFHLDTFGAYNVGDSVSQGNPLGTVGKTGFASGYHLHWELRINNIAVDPLQWTQQDF